MILISKFEVKTTLSRIIAGIRSLRLLTLGSFTIINHLDTLGDARKNKSLHDILARVFSNQASKLVICCKKVDPFKNNLAGWW